MTAPDFDVRAYMRAPRILRPEDLGPAQPGTLQAPALDLLGHLWAVEAGALARLRDLLVTPTHAESRTTAFLSTWAHEQHWLGVTLQALLDAHGRTAREPADTPAGRLRRTWDDRCGPTATAIGTNLLNADVTGAHMVIGWLDAAVPALAYRWLGRTEPVLEEFMRAVGGVKERHTAFYAAEARARLADPATRRLTRVAVRRWRFPGTRYAGTGPARAATAGLRRDPGTRAAVGQLDRVAAAFPGLTGMQPVGAAFARLAGPPRAGHRSPTPPTAAPPAA